MRGLLIKDFLVLKKEMGKLLIILSIFLFVGDIFVMSIPFISVYIPLIALAYDEKAKWNTYSKMLPIKRIDISLSKYYLGYISVVIVTLFIALFKCLMVRINPGYITITYEMLFYILIGVLSFQAINLPILFKFGVDKGRIFFILVMMSVGILGSLINQYLPNTTTIIQILSPQLLIITTIVINVISIGISTKIKI